MFKKEILTDPNIAVRCETREHVYEVADFCVTNNCTINCIVLDEDGWLMVRGEANKILTYAEALAEEKEPRKGQIVMVRRDAYPEGLWSLDRFLWFSTAWKSDKQIVDCKHGEYHDWRFPTDEEWEIFKNGEVE